MWLRSGLIGLAVIVLATAFNGIVNEHSLGRAFQEALPFTALLVTFFAIVAIIHDQGLFAPVIDWVLAQDGRQQLTAMFAASGILSAISDNVFVATIYINEVAEAFAAGFDRPGAVRAARDRGERRHEHPERGDARTGRPRSCSSSPRRSLPWCGLATSDAVDGVAVRGHA